MLSLSRTIHVPDLHSLIFHRILSPLCSKNLQQLRLMAPQVVQYSLKHHLSQVKDLARKKYSKKRHKYISYTMWLSGYSNFSTPRAHRQPMYLNKTTGVMIQMTMVFTTRAHAYPPAASGPKKWGPHVFEYPRVEDRVFKYWRRLHTRNSRQWHWNWCRHSVRINRKRANEVYWRNGSIVPRVGKDSSLPPVPFLVNTIYG